MMKRMLSFFLIIALIAASLASCGGSGENVTDTGTEAVSEENTSEKVTDKEAEKDTEKVTDKETEKDTEKVTDKETEKDTEKVTDKETEKETEKVTDKETDRETEKETEGDTQPPITGYETPEVSMSENGLVSWKAIPGAIKYEYAIADGVNWLYVGETKNTYVQLYEGYSLHVRPVFEGGNNGLWAISDVYGDPAKKEDIRIGMIDPDFSTVWQDLSKYELISNIKFDTLKTNSDGSIYFEANGPKNNTLRFIGKDITVEKGSITFKNTCSLVCLDSIGRICIYESIAENADSSVTMGINISAAYSFAGERSVDSPDDLVNVPVTGLFYSNQMGNDHIYTYMFNHQPNFISLSGYAFSEKDPKVTELTIYYDEKTYNTPIREILFSIDFYGAYLEGEKYDPKRERFDSSKGILDFYLIAVPEVYDRVNYVSTEELAESNARAMYGIEDSTFEVGALTDAKGNVLDKATHKLKGGEYIELKFGNKSFKVELPVVSYHKTANNMNELVPYAFPEAKGDLNVLAIPIVWRDEPEDASSDMLAMYRSEFGRVMDKAGNTTDYSDQMKDKDRYSLSRYYDIASYGKLKVRTFITDWYYAPYDFSEMKNHAPSIEFTDELLKWIYSTYSDMDLSKFDKDGNGYFDAVVFINAGDLDENGYNIISFGGGIMTKNTYTGEFAGTPERPAFNCYTTMNTHLLKNNTLIHEFAHNLGLVDYYDVTYSGIDAIGKFDMQSQSLGDWNPYSKYSVGWIEPEVVKGLNKGESVEISIGAFATTGDAIVIPGASSSYFETPFSEYIMIDLFTDKGVNNYDSQKYGFDLKGATGVRIYHVNSLMEYRELIVDGDSKTYPIGTIHTTNVYDITGEGNYLIELIQAGKDNTFTDIANLRTSLRANDLFKKGDVFTAEKYSEFFYNGLMADGTEFGYTVEIVNITAGDEPTATIRITRN